jgi:hypothetical protein
VVPETSRAWLDRHYPQTQQASVSTGPLVPETPDAGVAITGVAPAPGETCPTCSRKVPKPKPDIVEDKLKTTWSLAIPTWARTHGEDGHTILTELVSLAGDILEKAGYDVKPDRKGRAYDVLVKALGDFCERHREHLKA